LGRRSTLFSDFIESLVLFQSSKDKRDALIFKIIELTEECLALRNYNSFQLLYRAITMNLELHESFLDAAKKKYKAFFTKMTELFKTERNDGNVQRLVEQSELPCIPMFHFYGKDLAELEKYKFVQKSTGN